MSSGEIVDYFKDKKNSYVNAFKGVQNQIPRFEPLSEGRYDAVAFELLCSKMDAYSRLKNEGVPFSEILGKILPKTIEEAVNSSAPSDYRISSFYYLSSIIATKHVYKDEPGVVKACGELFTTTVRQMVADRATYVDGAGGGPLRDCRYPEQTGENLSDMQKVFNSDLGQTLRQEGLGPVMDVAQETIECTNLLKPYFEEMRTKEGNVESEISSHEKQISELKDQAVIVRQQSGADVVRELANFNPFADNPEQ